jgi:hypothetical protein
MHIEIEPELESVLQFMESKISADKLLSVADALPGAARLLWKHSAMEQEPMAMARLSKEPISPSDGSRRQQVAT